MGLNFMGERARALHQKPYFIFPNVLKRWSFQKIALEYDLMIFFLYY